MANQAVILAGGLGTRLGMLTKQTPKPLLPVSERPFLEYLVWNLKRYEITNIIFSIGFYAEKIMNHFGNGSKYGVTISYVIEKSPLGTGGGLKTAHPKLHDEFYVLNGDTLFDINLLDLSKKLAHSKALAALSLRKVEDASRYGSVIIKNNKIVGFNEKYRKGPGIISGGVYVFKSEALDFLSDGVSSIEKDLFPLLAQRNLLVGDIYKGFFIDIGLPKTYDESNILLPKWLKKRAVIFDSGVVFDHTEFHDNMQEKWKLNPGSVESIKHCNDGGYLVFLVINLTNGLEKNISKSSSNNFRLKINEIFNKYGAHLDDVIIFSDHINYSNFKYNNVCYEKKIFIDAIENIKSKWNFDFMNSFFIRHSRQEICMENIKSLNFKNGDDLLNFITEKIPFQSEINSS